ncbi:MAG: 3-dehydroquinate synthase [Gammaproteobacteria bacterium]|nr:3-dehydroquinate synthase [Gammaproteobacteria bacterium]
MQLKVLKQKFAVEYNYPVYFSEHIFDPENRLLRDIVDQAGMARHKIMLVIDSGVLDANPDIVQKVKAYCEKFSSTLQLTGEPLIVKGGEVCKMAPLEVKQFYDKVAEEAICRHSFALVIGGGAVLDAIGFAAATAHRGVRIIRVPSTVLAQNDAGIGVKNGINHEQRKNFVGTFAPPYAVINDHALIDTLEARDKRAGIAEAIKVALIKDAGFFSYLYNHRNALASFQRLSMQHMILRCAELHLEHITGNGDPFEYGTARPLDFGHWLAHKLEEMTHATLRHGEAVAIGVMLDSMYSWRLGKLSDEQMGSIYELISDLGFSLYHYELDKLDVAGALNEFREHLGGELCITLLEDIGKSREYNRIDIAQMQACLDDLKLLHEGEVDRVFLTHAQLELPLAG